MKTRNKIVLLTLAVVALGVAGLVTVEAAVDTPGYLYNCSGSTLANFTFNVTDTPDPVTVGDPLNYTIGVTSNPPGANLSGIITLWFGRDYSVGNVTSSSPGWSCTVYSAGTECATGGIWDGMSMTASTAALLNASGVLTTMVSPYGNTCSGWAEGFANTDTAPIPVELQLFVVE